MNWEDAVINAIRRYTERHQSPRFSRQGIVAEELPAIIHQTGTTGNTPAQTLSRTLQLLRDRGLVTFVNNEGDYLYLEKPIAVESHDLSDQMIDAAIQNNKLLFGTVRTSTEVTLMRCRRGQDRLRRAVLLNYSSKCAMCDIVDESLLVTSHIVRWADDSACRGDLSNLLCLCRFHDILFENGYFSLSDELSVIKRTVQGSDTLRVLLDSITEFKAEPKIAPAPRHLARHRNRTAITG